MSKTNSIETPKGRARFTFSGRLIEELTQLTLKTEMAPDSAGVRSGLVSLSDRFESSSGIYSSR